MTTKITVKPEFRDSPRWRRVAEAAERVRNWPPHMQRARVALRPDNATQPLSPHETDKPESSLTRGNTCKICGQPKGRVKKPLAVITIMPDSLPARLTGQHGTITILCPANHK